MTTVIVLIIILSILVLIHEFGHFFVARRVDVRVEEFGWGLPPRAWGKRVGETLYSINWLPFGGFVKLTGEDFGEEGIGSEQRTTNDGQPLLDKKGNLIKGKDSRNFKNKSPLQRGLILVAGVFMNVVLAIALYYTMFFMTGFKTMTLPLFFEHEFRFGHKEVVHTTVTAFSEGSPAQEAGINIGEAVIEVDGTPVYNIEDVRGALKENGGNEVSVLLMDLRGVERTFRTVKLVPQQYEDGYILGVLLTDAFRLDYNGARWTAGLMHTWNMFSYSTSTLWNLTAVAVQEKDVTYVSDSVAGPVGITRAVSGILGYKEGNILVGLIDLTALLSISLAFLNILPFPALDGGRLLFVIIEGTTGKKFSDETEGIIHKWGMIALLGLIGLITIKDVLSLF